MFWLYIHSYRSFAYNDITKNCFLAEKELKYEKKKYFNIYRMYSYFFTISISYYIKIFQNEFLNNITQ